jgi:hypothetical protein
VRKAACRWAGQSRGSAAGCPDRRIHPTCYGPTGLPLVHGTATSSQRASDTGRRSSTGRSARPESPGGMWLHAWTCTWAAGPRHPSRGEAGVRRDKAAARDNRPRAPIHDNRHLYENSDDTCWRRRGALKHNDTLPTTCSRSPRSRRSRPEPAADEAGRIKRSGDRHAPPAASLSGRAWERRAAGKPVIRLNCVGVPRPTTTQAPGISMPRRTVYKAQIDHLQILDGRGSRGVAGQGDADRRQVPAIRVMITCRQLTRSAAAAPAAWDHPQNKGQEAAAVGPDSRPRKAWIPGPVLPRERGPLPAWPPDALHPAALDG